jgi:large subunit ribosomal protein L21
MTYAIISIGGKQHRVREGERLLVDRLAVAEGKTFHPDILLVGGDGDVDLEAKGVQVTALVVKHDLGPKIRIGKYKPKKGYKRHNGHRSRLTQIEIQAIGKKATRAKKETAPAEEAEQKTEAETGA